jgi:hypothetical protein
MCFFFQSLSLFLKKNMYFIYLFKYLNNLESFFFFYTTLFLFSLQQKTNYLLFLHFEFNLFNDKIYILFIYY